MALGGGVEFFTSLLKVEDILDLIQDICNHEFYALVDHIEVIVFIQLISRVKDIDDFLSDSSGKAYSVIFDESRLHEEMVVDDDMFCPEEVSISPV